MRRTRIRGIDPPQEGPGSFSLDPVVGGVDAAARDGRAVVDSEEAAQAPAGDLEREDVRGDEDREGDGGAGIAERAEDPEAEDRDRGARDLGEEEYRGIRRGLGPRYRQAPNERADNVDGHGPGYRGDEEEREEGRRCREEDRH